ncbi:23S rRNA pseudouridine(955/2504/2580) synthase RluC [Glaciecola sp. XM2]|jgi:23S rRNA pseudouridine955/2504/2580 synthase|uniref:23S rRNA pseudouridine(955/2504/2580) synthase RluC n=1 Tax=Glaciecola sp. XM2 TaxID=1914931 RepID=UPI001BDED0CD|nr:23S rRNA pseudouridine(955/2504/2580) synthase RluC [Glaciecola sp. XM2]MBT1449704.1 23S rRNA pseudouridine(955/2504/2580) synthase RluC [Glaciecola sp. XM2]
MTTSYDKVQFVRIEEDEQHQRIDNYLMRVLKGVPKSKIYRILRKGEIRVNKKRVKPEYKLQANDEIRIPPVRLEAPAAVDVSAQQVAYLESAILYEDERLIVLNKPSGVAVHGGSGLHYGVIEGLRILRPNAPFLELVHRLDRDTSGCLLIAKKRSALRHLHEQLRNNQVDKIYHALVSGTWPKNRGKVKAPLYKNTLQSGERMVQVSDEGKPSETHYRVLQTYTHSTLVEAKPITGRTHQIRVHCLHAGHPIACDPKYGDPEFDKRIKGLGCKRLFLHASKIRFIHPRTEEQVSFFAPYDDKLSMLIEERFDAL